MNLSFGGVMWKKASVELSKCLDPQHIAIALTKMINQSEKNKMIFPCSVNVETEDQPTGDVLSSQRCEAEEDSVVVLDSRYYSFTRRPILENHFAFLPLS